ncbi:MAG: hypothetical protein HY075_04380, partial [Deltaproteobacteria bacterium]|nr:hypothetical protein [Deltaproteobacteria bacterium]
MTASNTGVEAALPSVGLVDQGLSVTRPAPFDESTSAVGLCVEGQAAAVPSGYQLVSGISIVDVALNSTLISAQLPLARVSSSYGALLSRANGMLTLSLGADTIGQSSDSSFFAVSHQIGDASRYSGTVQARTFYPVLTGTGPLAAIMHAAAPVVESDLTLVVKADDLASRNAATQEDESRAASIKRAGVFALVRASDHDEIIGETRGVSHVTQSLLVAALTGESQGLVSCSGTGPCALSINDVSAITDWQLGGPYYSRTGNFSSYSDYANIAHAKGELVVAASSTEREMWADLFRDTSISSVNALQSAAEHGQALIQGEQLTDATEAGIFARFDTVSGAPMTAYEPFLRSFEAEKPYLYSANDSIKISFNTFQDFVGQSFILMPSDPTGHAGAFLSISLRTASQQQQPPSPEKGLLLGAGAVPVQGVTSCTGLHDEGNLPWTVSAPVAQCNRGLCVYYSCTPPSPPNPFNINLTGDLVAHICVEKGYVCGSGIGSEAPNNPTLLFECGSSNANDLARKGFPSGPDTLSLGDYNCRAPSSHTFSTGEVVDDAGGCDLLHSPGRTVCVT